MVMSSGQELPKLESLIFLWPDITWSQLMAAPCSWAQKGLGITAGHVPHLVQWLLGSTLAHRDILNNPK